jgi:hypothetical protein
VLIYGTSTVAARRRSRKAAICSTRASDAARNDLTIRPKKGPRLSQMFHTHFRVQIFIHAQMAIRRLHGFRALCALENSVNKTKTKNMTTYTNNDTGSRAPGLRKRRLARLVLSTLATLGLNRGASKRNFLVLFVCVFALASEGQVPLIRSDAGVDGPVIQATVDQFRADLGLHREINWDGVPDNLAAPYFLPGDFFNSRGAFFSTPGAGVQVSADSSNPTSTAVRFGNINPTYPDIFKTFSAERLFSPIGSSIVDLTFFVPGTNTPALVKGFGAVYADPDVVDATSFQYFDVLGNSLGNFPIPTSNNGLSFLGVSFDSPIVRRVRIIYGNSALGPNDGNGTDVAVMDDFIYGEPQAVPESMLPPLVTIRVSQVEVCWNSTSNLTYQVQYRSDLTTNLWTSLVDCVRSIGSKSCISDPVVVGQPQRFYRVVQTNCVPPL